MSWLAALALAAASVRIDSVAVVSAGDVRGVRLGVSAPAGRIVVARDGDRARVSVRGARLGRAFAGGSRFSWSPPPGPPRWPVLERVDLAAGDSEVQVVLAVAAATALEVRQAKDALWLVLRQPEEPVAARRAGLAAAAPPEPAAVPAAPAPAVPPPAVPPAAEPAPARPDDVVELARRLFPLPAGPAAEQGDTTDGIGGLYGRLFPSAAPEAEPAEPAGLPAAAEEPLPGAAVGPLRLRASLAARYVDADTYLDTKPTKDRYFELGPAVEAAAALGRGRLSADYRPALRAFAIYDQVNRSSHLADAALELPVGGVLTQRAGERFASGTLDTRLVDPGGEYFYGLGRFQRNDATAGAGVAALPRLTLRLSGSAGRVRFREPSTFFDYDTRSATAGLEYELAPGLSSTVAYACDAIPRPPARPEAEARGHSLSLALDGELGPLLSGKLVLGYRRQQNPAAAEGGRSYSGLVASGALTRRLGRDSALSVALTRSTPPSAFEGNGFYVTTGLQLSAEAPLPLALQLRGGVGLQRNAYRTPAAGIAEPRRDDLVAWYAALRRPLGRGLTLGASYHAADRRSNLDRFDSDSSGFVLQLDWDALGARGR